MGAKGGTEWEGRGDLGDERDTPQSNFVFIFMQFSAKLHDHRSRCDTRFSICNGSCTVVMVGYEFAGYLLECTLDPVITESSYVCFKTANMTRLNWFIAVTMYNNSNTKLLYCETGLSCDDSVSK